MSVHDIDAAAWQESWDRQQEEYLPDREERFDALLDVVEVVTDGRPAAVLDLASGPGSISLRALRRFPRAVNVDCMPDDGLAGLTGMMRKRERARWAARVSASNDLPWDTWWGEAGRDPSLGPLLEQRRTVFPDDHPAEHAPPVSWHLDTLRSAGYTQAGIIWRRGKDAAAAGIR